MKIALIDYGAGNLFSVQRALKFVGADYYLATRPEQILTADKLILPGVGAFADGMANLKKNQLDQAIKTAVLNNKKPILGICLGMQLMMTEGLEFGRTQGLNLIPGLVNKINTQAKLPQIGWNNIKINSSSPLLTGLKTGDYFYFVHSYVVRPKNNQVIAATTSYGQDVFCSVISYNQVYGTQFHPEKSGNKGLKIYQNFVRNVRPAAGG